MNEYTEEFKNLSPDEQCKIINEMYSGMNMKDIMEIKAKKRQEARIAIDAVHKAKYGDRSRMLTVKKLIDFLKTCNPDACVLGFETNSFAYIEQSDDIPNHTIRTVADDRNAMIENLENWYKDSDNKIQKISEEVEETYRYAHDDDIVMRFGD